MTAIPLRERILRNIEIEESGCWRWSKRLDVKGYGRMMVGSRPHLAHRVSYEQFTGPIRAGLELDHLCRNRACVNPDHLEAVTHATNMRRGPATAREVCANGHLQDLETRRETVRANGQIHRACRKCEAAASQRYKARKSTNTSKESN